MALRDQPYIPLYIQDFLTDEKLIECSAKATGVYVRLMCIMHKSEDYGKVLLKQKDKQKDKQMENFAIKLGKQMPYSQQEIYDALTELVAENVLTIEGDFLVQKRMVNDNLLSLKRANAGSKGGKFAQAKHKAKASANTENESEVENEIEIKNKGEFEIFDDWIFWGNLIVDGNDAQWEAMRGRKVTRAEMDSFLSVATRNKWKMETQGEFRISLKGFEVKSPTNGQVNQKERFKNL